MIRVLIADDEPLARERLHELLAMIPWAECVAEAASGPAAAKMIDDLSPDLVLLDIQMPGMTGIEILERVEAEPAVVFTTAYDRYAVAAFELGAVDYLLKPFGAERFQSAMDRARRTLGDTAAVRPSERAREVLDDASPLTRVFVRDGARILPVLTSAIERLEAEGDYVRLHTRDRHYLAYLPLAEFERRLDAERFLRIHRSHIVNLDSVVSFSWYDGGRLQVEMRDGTKLLASRTRSRELRRLTV